MASRAVFEIKCPCCGEHFQSDIRTTIATPGFTTTDFFTMSAGEESIHYQVHTCTNCGFTCEEPEDGELRDDVRSFVREVITPQLPEGDEIPSWKKYEFLALIDESLGAEPYSLGMLYLQAAWCCYDLKQREYEKIYREKAIEYFLDEIGSGNVDEDLTYLLPYLLAEQYRRTGNEDEASRWYNWVIEMDEEHPDRGLFMTLAAQQDIDPKEYMGEIIHEEQ